MLEKCSITFKVVFGADELRMNDFVFERERLLKSLKLESDQMRFLMVLFL